MTLWLIPPSPMCYFMTLPLLRVNAPNETRRWIFIVHTVWTFGDINANFSWWRYRTWFSYKKTQKSILLDSHLTRRAKQTDRLDHRCPTHSPLATCGKWPFKCGEWLYLQILEIKLLRTKWYKKLRSFHLIDCWQCQNSMKSDGLNGQ